MPDVNRSLVTTKIKVSNAPSESSRISLDSAAGGILLCPANCATGTVSFHLAANEEGPYVPLHGFDAVGAVGVDVSASIAKELPPSIFASSHLKIVSDVAQPAGAEFHLLQKS